MLDLLVKNGANVNAVDIISTGIPHSTCMACLLMLLSLQIPHPCISLVIMGMKMLLNIFCEKTPIPTSL